MLLVSLLSCIFVLLSFQNCKQDSQSKFASPSSPNTITDGVTGVNTNLIARPGAAYDDLVGQTAFEGDWVSECDQDNPEIRTMSFRKNVFTHRLELKEFCDSSENLVSFEIRSDFAIVGAGERTEFLTEYAVNMIEQPSPVVTVLSGAGTLNESNFCGFDDWVDGQERTIYQANDCENYVPHDLFGLENNTLLIGDTEFGDGSSEETRPTEFALETSLHLSN